MLMSSTSSVVELIVVVVPSTCRSPAMMTLPVPEGSMVISPFKPSAIVIKPLLLPLLVFNVRSPVPLVVSVALVLASPTSTVDAVNLTLPLVVGSMVILPAAPCAIVITPLAVPLLVFNTKLLAPIVVRVLFFKLRLSTFNSVETVITPVLSAILAAAVPSLALMLVTSILVASTLAVASLRITSPSVVMSPVVESMSATPPPTASPTTRPNFTLNFSFAIFTQSYG